VGAERLFLVSCRHCRVPTTLVARVGHEELDALLAHVRSWRPNEAPRPPGGSGSDPAALRRAGDGGFGVRQPHDWSAGRRDLGRQVRRGRDFVGLSQEQPWREEMARRGMG